MSKPNKVIIYISVIAGLVGIGYGLYKFVTHQIKSAMNFCYKMSNISFIDLSAKLITFRLELKFLQNSDFRINVKRYEFDIIINNRVVAKVSENKSIDILPKAVSYATTVVSFSPEKIFKGSYLGDLIYSATLNQSKFVIQVKGQLFAQINFLPFPISIDVKMTLAEILKPAPADPTKDKNLVCKIY